MWCVCCGRRRRWWKDKKGEVFSDDELESRWMMWGQKQIKKGWGNYCCLKRQNRKMIWRWLHCIALKGVQSKSTMSFYNQACSMWSEWTLVHLHSQCCYIHVSHCTKQQVPLPVPYSLKLNWACTCSEAACLTQSSVSSSPCECISQSPPFFLRLNTCHPLPRVCGCLCTVRRMWRGVLGWRVRHDVLLLTDCKIYIWTGELTRCLMRKSWRVWPSARKEVDEWLSDIYGGIHEGLCHNVDCCNLI